MRCVHISDPAGSTTFPFRITPRPDEWLPGLLLRCDEANRWGSRTTLSHILSGPEKFHRCWRTETPHLMVIQPNSLNLDYVAQLLALPTPALLATTYHTELTRLYKQATSRSLEPITYIPSLPTMYRRGTHASTNAGLATHHDLSTPSHGSGFAVPLRHTAADVSSTGAAIYVPWLRTRLGRIASDQDRPGLSGERTGISEVV
jgi:hypothetical protein